MASPPESRALPGSLWEHAPESLSRIDTAWREWSVSHADPIASPWREIKWLTESPVGTKVLFLVCLSIAAWMLRRRNLLNRARFKSLLQGSFAVLLVGGAADLISNALKVYFGRLKPHVTFYNPKVLPALSLPSSHAFNTACMLAFLWAWVGRPARDEWSGSFAALLGLTLIIGASRVFLGEHYPFDVATGWILGSATGTIMGWALRRTTRRSSEAPSRDPRIQNL